MEKTDLPGHVTAMLDPGFHEHSPAWVELMQTQMSFVVLAGDLVYKIKKPTNLGYLDYTTLDRRRFFCEREVELNRRLCPQAYLGTVPIMKQGARYAFDGPGEVVDYAVKMRHLPQDRMMNVLLGKNEVTNEMIGRVASRLVEFHQRAETSPAIAEFGNIDSIRTNTEENFSQTRAYIGRTISQAKYDRIRQYARRFLDENTTLFNHRVQNGRIRDCHGDLHAAHVCLTDSICIYDCIEFNERFRYGDVSSEIAFLAMDLDHYGRADLANGFVESYVNLSGDSEMPRLMRFYKCYRAYVRGKVEGFRSVDPYVSEDEKKQAELTARGYLDLAAFYVRPRPTLFVTVGLTGTGKSTLARSLSRRTGLSVISSDVVRKTLAGVPLTERHHEGFNTGLYAADFSRRTYDTMLAQAESSLESGTSVMLDASFIRAADRQRAKALAERKRAGFLVVECTLEEAVIRQWLARRMQGSSVSDGRPEILEPQMQQYEPVTELDEREFIRIDMSTPMETRIRQVLEKIGEG